ncbi:MAG TPA: hypothetical protein VFQ07_04690 [Candidatus Polarisedimenticolia bacterium]|nr:hypothetical protein [Candidatus Polarisedimenticolia bacterium]
MKRLPMVFLFALVAVAALAALQPQASPQPQAAPELQTTQEPPVCAADGAPVAGAVPQATPLAGGACGCPKTTPVCCRNCNGTFAYCARSFAFCPECPAP